MRAPARHRLSNALGAFARAERGGTAVEFALISLPFMVLIFGILELALVFLAATTLENAVENASRKIRTGEFQTSAASNKSDFKALVCGGMTWLGADCGANLTVDVRTFSNFASLANNDPLPASTFTEAQTCWSPGQPGDIVLVRAYYKWKLFTPVLDGALQNMGGGTGTRLISMATAFRNEPFDDEPPVGAAC